MNPTVRARRALARLRADGDRTSTRAAQLRSRSLDAGRGAGRRIRQTLGRGPSVLPVEADSIDAPAGQPPGRRDGAHRVALLRVLRPIRLRAPRPDGGLAALAAHLTGRERALPLIVAALVLIASIVSVAPVTGRPGSEGTDPGADAPRLVVGGGVLGPVAASGGTGDVLAGGPDPTTGESQVLGAVADTSIEDTAAQSARSMEAGQDEPMPAGPYLADGTLLKPVAVDPTVPDGRDQLRTYRVKSGDTLTGIANKFDVSMMTIWWANKLAAKDDLHVGQTLIIPPVNGLVVTVGAEDTLDSIAARTGTPAGEIIDFNDLVDSTLVVGQVLIVPGALGDGIATPTPKPTPKPAARSTVRSSGGSKATTKGPSSYGGGRFAWPIPGHRVTQYYHYGHLGVDIQGSTGDRVYAAAGGTVIYAGWRNNGGGYVVWISHGSGLYTTYNHLSAVLVRTGASVGRGQLVGRVGATGWATGPHLHFEVWRGGVPGGTDRRVNPMAYY